MLCWRGLGLFIFVDAVAHSLVRHCWMCYCLEIDLEVLYLFLFGGGGDVLGCFPHVLGMGLGV